MCHDGIDRKAERDELSDEELEAQRGEPLPDREVMTVIAPDGSSVPGFEMPSPIDDGSPYPRDPLPIQ